MSNQSVFSTRLLIALIGAALLALAVSLYFSKDEGDRPDRLGPTVYSSSALGYAGLAALLEKLGVPVEKSRGNSVKKAEDGLLIIAEPRLKSWTDQSVNAFFEAPKVLLVLPKWQAEEGTVGGRWVARVSRKSFFEAQMVLNLVLSGARVVREPSVDAWTTNSLGRTPPLAKDLQLIKSDQIDALVASEKGILFGEIRKDGQTIWVLSDPDLIANHSFGKDGKGAVFSAELIRSLWDGRGKVVFDETIHGFAFQPSTISRLLFEFPYAVVTLMCAAAIALLLWATMGRFGAPSPAPNPLTAGKQGLVENVAKLMDFAGHQKLMVRRYVEATIRDTARQIHAPKGLSQSQMIEFLGRAAKARNVDGDSAEILRRTDALLARRGNDITSFVDIAQDIHRWKQEILDGPSRHSRNH